MSIEFVTGQMDRVLNLRTNIWITFSNSFDKCINSHFCSGFFATSDGKGPIDDVGETDKRIV